MTKWLLEQDMFDDDLLPLAKEIKKQGFEYKIVKYIPFEGDNKYLSYFSKDDCVLFYGSLQMARQIIRQSAWIPGAFCDLPKFECTYYYPRLGKYLLNKNYVMLSYGELKRRKDFLISTLGIDGCVFVRPSSGFKLFTGKVVDSRNWDKDVDFFGFYNVEPERIVVVAEPVVVKKEWRLVVVNKQIVAGGQYLEEKTATAPKEVIDFGQKVVNECDYNPNKAWCLDICESSGELYVLEVGCFSSAGLYNIDPESIIREVSKVALEEWEELQ